jgi:hypothetical protein
MIRRAGGACGADYLGECLLADFRYDRFRFPFLAKIRHQKEHPRQTLFARIEKLVDQIFLDAGFPSQQERHERLGKFRFIVEHAHQPLPDRLADLVREIDQSTGERQPERGSQ